MEWIEPFVKFGLPTILLIVLYRDARTWIEAGQKKCDEANAALANEVKASHKQCVEILESTVKETNQSRERQAESFNRQSASFDRLTVRLGQILPNIKQGE